MDNDVLTDQQIDELLHRAEARLKGLVSTQNATPSAHPQNGQISVVELHAGAATKSYVIKSGEIARADPGRLLDDQQGQRAGTIRCLEDPMASKRKSLENQKATAGPNWFNLPRTNLTPELKRDLQLLRMRSVLDPKRHYKKENGRALAPEFSQVGTIVEGPTEFYSSRIQNKHRRRTLAEEIMVGERYTGRFKSKYDEVQYAKTSGKKAHYKALKAKRSRSICP